MQLAKLSDANPSIKAWGVNFPLYVDMYNKMQEDNQTTDFGGSNPYSKLIRYPQLLDLWGGYPFAVDFNEERGHYYTQIDQYETKRNDKEYLNSHGLPAFKGQPAACMNCHSGWVPSLVKEMGWEKFNSTPYWEIVKKLEKEHGDDIHGSKLGSACADCHNPKDMSLRVTRQAFVNAMVARGYEADKEQGIKASRTEMRNFVCNQCHVEYYFQGDSKVLTFPWNDWPKDKPFRIEMLDTYYDNAKANNVFLQDFLQKGTKTPVIKIQHPETELYSSGIHARSGVTCADCHMPYKREGGQKVSNHTLKSPLDNVNSSCKSCHAQNEKDIIARVKTIQLSTANSLRESEKALVALITDIKIVRAELAKKPNYASIADETERDKAISKELEPVLTAHRKAQMRWDFVFSENSTGFHSPQEATRVLAQSMDMSRGAQAQLVAIAAKNGIMITPTKEPVMPKAPAPIPPKEPNSKVGATPPAFLQQIDKESISF